MNRTLRRIPRYSVRTLIVCVFLFGAFYAFAASRRTAVKRHHVAISALRERGAQVELILWSPELSPQMDKLLTRAGMSPYVSVHFIDLRSKQFSDEDEVRQLLPFLRDLIPRRSNQRPALKLRDDLNVDFVRTIKTSLPHCTIEYNNRVDWSCAIPEEDRTMA
jgi:hypothetical protein